MEHLKRAEAAWKAGGFDAVHTYALECSHRGDSGGRRLSRRRQWADGRGRLGPEGGLVADEFQFHVLTLAVEADRFEHQLTGKDVQ